MLFRAKYFKTILAVLVIALSGYYIARIFFNSWNQVSSHLNNIHWPYLFAGGFCFVGYFLLRATSWSLILSSLDSPLQLNKALKIWNVSEFSRYIPGNVWSFFSRVLLTNKYGLKKSKVILSLGLEIVMLTGSAALFACFFLWLLPYESNLSIRWLFLLLIPILIILLSPSLISKTLNFFLKLLKREPVNIYISSLNLLKIMTSYLLTWFMYGLGSYFLMIALISTTISWFWLVSAFIIAWLIGYLSFITPMGLGVREGVIIVILAPLFGSSIGSLIAVSSRLILIITEIIVLGGVYLMSYEELKPILEDKQKHLG